VHNSLLRFDEFEATPLVKEPFEYLIVPNFIRADAVDGLIADYPILSSPGSFPIDGRSFGPSFASLLEELNGDQFREAFERKFAVELAGHATITTVRGRCGKGDGKIHTDSASKIITVLLYLNEAWNAVGGRLRLLRSGTDLDDVVAEVEPAAGTLLAFKRSSNSWHGHRPFVGERRVIQFNWLTGTGHRRIAMLRHQTSASVKRLLEAIWSQRQP